MKTYMELLDIIYSPCIYFLYIFHVVYAIEMFLVAYMKHRNIFRTNFKYYTWQFSMSLRNLLVMRIGIWLVLLYLDSFEQTKNAVAATCEPSFSGSIILILSIGYCTKMILDEKRSQKE